MKIRPRNPFLDLSPPSARTCACKPLGAHTAMVTAQPSVAPTVRAGVLPLRAGEGSSFLWRKLHSLLGIIPLGAFLLEHMLSNFEALKGPIAYGEQVRFLNSLSSE